MSAGPDGSGNGDPPPGDPPPGDPPPGDPPPGDPPPGDPPPGDAPVEPCGNGVIDQQERCDTALQPQVTCQQLDMDGPGPVGCLPNCVDWDLSKCGNDSSRDCDDYNPKLGYQCNDDGPILRRCRDVGFDSSKSLRCLQNCTYDLRPCR